MELEVTEDPSLVAGAKARIGDIVLDNSIAAQIEKMRTEVENNLELRTRGKMTELNANALKHYGELS